MSDTNASEFHTQTCNFHMFACRIFSTRVHLGFCVSIWHAVYYYIAKFKMHYIQCARKAVSIIIFWFLKHSWWHVYNWYFNLWPLLRKVHGIMLTVINCVLNWHAKIDSHLCRKNSKRKSVELTRLRVDFNIYFC
jgi:hypothetical protein